MNIDQYRALKAEQDSTHVEQPQVTTETTNETTPNQPSQATPEQITDGQTETPNQPQTITLNGKEYTHEEMQEWQNGYMRNADYTQKTQELSALQKEYNKAITLLQSIQQNPELSHQVSEYAKSVLPTPEEEKISELEAQLNELLLDKEANELKQKYEDFDYDAAIEVAQEKGIDDLEDAFLLSRSLKGAKQPSVDMEALKNQLRDELRKELELQANTQTIISTNTGNTPHVSDNEPELSSKEIKIARGMGMTPKEYAKWRDLPRRK